MPEWVSYGLSDFLLFSPRAYWRLFELHNAAWWPLPLLMLGAGIALLVLAALRPRGHLRWSAAILGLLWLWVAWGFLWRLYAAINWAAVYVAPVFALQAALLLALAWRGPPAPRLHGASSLIGWSLIAAAVLLYPTLAPLSGRPWIGAEIFGMAPDPTALATLCFALLLRGRWALALLPVPFIWLCISALTLWQLAQVQGGG